MAFKSRRGNSWALLLQYWNPPFFFSLGISQREGILPPSYLYLYHKGKDQGRVQEDPRAHGLEHEKEMLIAGRRQIEVKKNKWKYLRIYVPESEHSQKIEYS